jgi:hypothetical protein
MVSARASQDEPTAPTDGVMPAVAIRSLQRMAMYWASSTGRSNTSLLKQA